MNVLNLADFERRAAELLPQMALDYYRGGAHDELSLHDNLAAFRRLRLHPRVLVDVSQRSTGTTVLGHPVAMPVLVAPTAFHRLAHPDGELATVRGTGEANTVMVLSTLSTTDVEAVVGAATAPVWFQLYVYRDREATRALVQRAEASGCSALVLTVDAATLGTRERDVRNRFHLPAGFEARNLVASGYAELPERAGSGLASYVDELLDSSLSWKDVDWLRSITHLPIVVKGILRPDDAVRACHAGVAGIVVSNHGGRQLDGAVAAVDVLEGISQAIDGKAEIYVDGGIRRGSDVLKALALGARAVLVGRPVLWGLAVSGEVGVRRVLQILQTELDQAMALCGCTAVESIPRDLVTRGVA